MDGSLTLKKKRKKKKEQYMFSQCFFMEVEKYFVTLDWWLAAREGTWRSSGVAEYFITLDCARRHLAIVGSG